MANYDVENGEEVSGRVCFPCFRGTEECHLLLPSQTSVGLVEDPKGREGRRKDAWCPLGGIK